MKSAASRPARRRIAAGALALTALLGATGCSAVSPIATGIQYDGSDGVSDGKEGLVEVRNLALVGEGESGPARMIGTLVNESDAAKTYEISVDGGGSATVEVQPDEHLSLEKDENKVELDRGQAWPGQNVDVTVSADGESATFGVPVVSATQEHYQEYLPEGVDASHEELNKHLDEVTNHYGEEEGGH